MIGIAQNALDQLNLATRTRDPAIAELFVSDALLVGSELGEIAQGRAAIAALLAAIQAKDYLVSWQFDRLEAGGDGDRAWFFGEGHVVLERLTSVARVPYRLSAVLVHTPDGWRWELFHGSEPKL
jgi:ketosteroid isomerase-like protein